MKQNTQLNTQRNTNPSTPNRTLKSTTIVALMIAAAGLTSSVASAQFKFDRSKNNEKQAQEIHEIVIHEEQAEPKKVTKNSSSTVLKVSDNEHVYDIELSDGRVISAVVDGKDFDLDRVHVKEDLVVFVGEDGKEVLYEIKLHNEYFEHGKHHENAQRFAKKDHAAAAWITGEPEDADHQIEWKSDGLPPKVMLGFYLGEPSIALRKHLNLDDNRKVIMVERVIKGLPAAIAGMQDFDVIVSLDGSEEADSNILNKILSKKEAGDQLKVYVLRGGKKVKLNVELKAYDAESMKEVEGFFIEPRFPTAPDAPRFPQNIDQKQSQSKAFRFEIDRDRLGEGIGNIEFEFFNKLDDGEFGNLPKPALEKLKRELKLQLEHLGQNQIHIEQIQKNAIEAMKGAERQIVELREGKLMVRDLAELKNDLAINAPRVSNALRDHVGGLEQRLEGLEQRLDEQVTRMDHQMDRLADMLERMMDRLDD